MANDVKLQEGHPVDENLRPLKIGGKSSSLELSQHENGSGARVTGDLEVRGDISSDNFTTLELHVGATGETVNKFLKSGGNNSSSWQTVSIQGTSVLSTGELGASKFLREDGDSSCSWASVPGGGISTTLSDGNIIVGNGSNVATSVNPSGDIDISNAGVFSIKSGSMVDDDVKSDAAIAYSKLGVIPTWNQSTSGTAAIATTVTLADNEDTDEENPIWFSAGAAGSGNIGAEADGTLTYNPSTGGITATLFTGNVTGNVSGTAATVTGAAQSSITSLGSLTTLTVDDVRINGKVITMEGSTGDTFTATVATDGVTTLATTDAGGTAADLTITADGDVAIGCNPGGAITLQENDGSEYTPAVDSDATTKAYVDAGHFLKQVEVTISEAEMTNLHSASKELIAAQGANIAIIPVHIIMYVDRDASTTQAGTGNLAIGYAGTTANGEIWASMRRFMWNESGDRVLQFMTQLAFEAAQGLTVMGNGALTATMTSAITAGSIDSVKCIITYYLYDES